MDTDILWHELYKTAPLNMTVLNLLVTYTAKFLCYNS